VFGRDRFSLLKRSGLALLPLPLSRRSLTMSGTSCSGCRAAPTCCCARTRWRLPLRWRAFCTRFAAIVAWGFGDGSCESGSNMARLAPPLCALDACAGSIHDMVAACVRRSVTFCLYRSFGVAKCVVKDVACVLRLGRVYVLKVLLDVRRDLLASDLSLLVRVWIED
jgi:hypothetical protein